MSENYHKKWFEFSCASISKQTYRRQTKDGIVKGKSRNYRFKSKSKILVLWMAVIPCLEFFWKNSKIECNKICLSDSNLTEFVTSRGKAREKLTVNFDFRNSTLSKHKQYGALWEKLLNKNYPDEKCKQRTNFITNRVFCFTHPIIDPDYWKSLLCIV